MSPILRERYFVIRCPIQTRISYVIICGISDTDIVLIIYKDGYRVVLIVIEIRTRMTASIEATNQIIGKPNIRTVQSEIQTHTLKRH